MFCRILESSLTSMELEVDLDIIADEDLDVSDVVGKKLKRCLPVASTKF